MIGLPFGLLDSGPGGGGGQFPQCVNISVFHGNSGNTIAGFRVTRAGLIQTIELGGSWTTVGNYVSSGLPDPDIGLLYQVEVVQLGGNALTGLNSGLSTWLDINTTRSWTMDDTPGATKIFDGTIQIRNKATPTTISGVCSADIETNDLA